MKIRGTTYALAFTLLFSQFALAQPGKMRLIFRHIGGQTYYEIIGVPKDAAKESIQAQARALLKRLHPDSGTGDHARTVTINEAYDILKDPDKRAQYDLWLDGTADRRKTTEPPSPNPREKTEAELRSETLEFIIRTLNKSTIEQFGYTDFPDAHDIADFAHLTLLYHVRFMPGASFDVSEIGNLIFETVFDRQNPHTLTMNGRLALAGGAIYWLKERARWSPSGYPGEDPQWWLDRVQHELAQLLKGGRYDNRYDLHRTMWWYVTGQDYQPEPRPQQRTSSGCDQLLFATVTDSEGRTYQIPIRVEIKIGF